ncbi:hypothetical protein TNCV_3383951 [Trichonephila clavipes]|uniref:Uncharacterized protein n=1 Tax=Trichonephila clavipes TaxID=2585209 RepID=A0A8X6VGM9_TRICX|nr:hypothetical protein TNCV_3383951 [Trichonephila clavipes]
MHIKSVTRSPSFLLHGVGDRNDCGNLVVKVTDSLLACHEFEPCTTEDQPCRGGRCTLNTSMLRRGGGYIKCPPHHLTMVQKLRDLQPKALVVAD